MLPRLRISASSPCVGGVPFLKGRRGRGESRKIAPHSLTDRSKLLRTSRRRRRRTRERRRRPGSPTTTPTITATAIGSAATTHCYILLYVVLYIQTHTAAEEEAEDLLIRWRRGCGAAGPAPRAAARAPARRLFRQARLQRKWGNPFRPKHSCIILVHRLIHLSVGTILLVLCPFPG